MKTVTMMKRIGIIIPILFSCSSKIENNNPQFENENNIQYTTNLKKIGAKQWLLDSITVPYFHSAFYNHLDSTLYYISDNNLVKCNLNQAQPTKIPINVNLSNFTVQNDTIIGIDYPSNSLVYYCDSVIWSKKLSHTIKYPPLPLTGIAPIINKENNVSFFGAIAGEPKDDDSINRPVFAHIDCTTDQENYSLGYPEIYRTANWGGGILWWVYADYIPHRNKYVVSYPVSHSLYLFDPVSEEVQEFYAGSRYIDNITAYSNDKTDAPTTEESLQFIAETSSYANIFYDPWRNIYYRFAEFSIPYRKGSTRISKPISIIILDDNLNKIGETKINNPGRNFRYGSFVSHLGLMIPKDTTEDLLTYEIYLP